MQRIQPVKHSHIPHYPTREEALACPGLLERLPERWRKSRQAAAAAGLLAAMAAAASGCGKPALAGTPTPAATPFTLAEATPMYAGAPTPYPILSEADACKNIEDAARAIMPALSAPYKLGGGGKPVTFVTYEYSGPGSGYQIVSIDEKEIDLFDAASGVGFEYIDEADQQSKSINFTEQTVSAPDTDHSYVLVIPPENADEASLKADIQKRVSDFLAWLKAEGII